MKLTDVRNIFKMLCETERLDEAMTSEFTFGFELEGCCTVGERRYNDLPGYHSGNEPRGDVKELFDKLNETLGFGEGKIESDSSLDTDRRGGWTFEYASPVIPFNPKNVEKVYGFLKNLPNLGVYTNSSCGFHTHISFPDITRLDASWMAVCCALDDGMYEELTSFQSEDGKIIDFFGGYAKPNRLRDIKEYIKDGNMRNLKRELDNDKYQVLRIHPDHGTLEWRGPRNFMNEGNIEDIHRYILKLYRVAQRMSKYTQMKSISSSDGVTFTKEQVAKLGISSSDSSYRFKSKAEEKLRSKGENLVKAIYNGKLSLSKLSKDQLQWVLNTGKWEVRDAVNNFFQNSKEEWMKMPKDTFNMLLAYYVNRLDNNILFIVREFFKKGFDVSSKLEPEMKEMLIRKIIQYIFNANSSSDEDVKVVFKLAEIYDVFNSEEFKNQLKGNIPAAQLIALINNARDKLAPEIIDKVWKALMLPKNIHYFSWINDVPVNIQRKLVRKNPFNIQYIMNPDPAVANWVKSKEPEAEKYMLGGI